MQFSLIVATVGRTDELQCFLASLCAQTHQGFELIVVDQNSDDRLAPVLNPYMNGFSIIHVRTESKGLSRARNMGLKHVTGDIVGFPDDDCLYPPDLLEMVAQFFADHPEKDGLTGRSVDKSGKTSMGRFDAEPGLIDRTNVWKRGIEYGMYFRRERVQGIWFDENLGVGAGTTWGSGEGTDYLLRLLERGVAMYYDPSLVVIHPPFALLDGARAARKAYSYGCGSGHVLRKHKMPLWFKGKWLIRPLGGAMLSLAAARLPEARLRWSTFRGRLRGLLS